MINRDYISVNDIQFLDRTKTLLSYATEKHETWGVLAPTGMISLLLDDYQAKLAKSKAPNSGKVDVLVKNEAKGKLEKACRTYVQGFLARNPNVSLEDRTMMSLPVYDTTPSSVPPPNAPVEGALSFPAPGLVEMRDIRASVDVADKRTGYGVRIYYGIMGEPSENDRFRISRQPKTGDDLPRSVFTRKKRYQFDFTGDNGKEIFFCMRFENSKGQTGPWGKIISAFIP